MRQEIPSKARIEIRLTEEEKAAIQAQAASLNMSVSDFIRYACKRVKIQQEVK